MQKPFTLLTAAIVIAALASAPAYSASGTWAVDADGNWSDPGNWSGGIVADDNTSIANFTNDISATRTVTLDSSRSIAGLAFSDNGAAGSSWVLQGPGVLSMDGASTSSISGITPVTISAQIAGTAPAIAFSGSNRLVVLTGNNTYGGITRLFGGTLRAQDGQGLPAASNLQFAGPGFNVVLESNGTFTRKIGTGAGQVSWSGLSNGGFSAYGGAFEVSLMNASNVAGGPLTWGSGGFMSPSLSSLLLNSVTADNVVDFKNPIALGASTRTITVVDNPSFTTDRAVLSGVLSGTGGLTKAGLGTLTLSGMNTYSGNTTLNATFGSGGTLQIGGNGALGSGGYNGAIAIASGGTFQYSSTAPQTLAGAVTGAGSFIKDTNTSVLILTNGGTNYSGATIVSAGTLQLAGTLAYASPTTVNSGGVLELAGALNASYGSWAGNALTLNTGATLNKTNSGFDSISGGNVILSGVTAINITNSGTNNQLFVGGVGTGLTGTGTLTITNSGSAITGLSFRNGLNATHFNGAMHVVGGALNIGASTGLALDNTNLTLTGAQMTMDGSAFGVSGASDASVKSLAGDSASSVLLGGQTLTLGANDGTGANFAGVISGTGNVVKTGTGTQTLSGPNSYSGTTTVVSGKLIVNGIHTGTGNVLVNAGATLGGSGVIPGQVIVSGNATISPGESPANMVFGSFSMLSGTYFWELAALTTAGPGTNFDVITVDTSASQVGGTAQVQLDFNLLAPASQPGNGDSFWDAPHQWLIFDVAGPASLTGNFASIVNANNSQGAFSLSGGNGDIFLDFAPIAAAQAPEPGSIAIWTLLGLAIAGFGWGRMRMRQA